MIRVLVADDDAMVRAGLVAILRTAGDLEIVATASDGAEAVASARSIRPDVAVLDVRMPRMDGIEATRQILRAGGATRVLVITTFEHDSYVYDALIAGAHGFLLKRAGTQQLIHAVRTLASTDAVLFPESIRDLVGGRQGRTLPPLSSREQQVLRAMTRGLSNAQIAGELQLGVETVKTYVAAILAKVGVRDRTQAVIAAFESGFVRPGDQRFDIS